jgi:hypothetical protein
MPSINAIQGDVGKGYGAGKGIRTLDPQLGKLMLYQLSYTRPEARS